MLAENCRKSIFSINMGDSRKKEKLINSDVVTMNIHLLGIVKIASIIMIKLKHKSRKVGDS